MYAVESADDGEEGHINLKPYFGEICPPNKELYEKYKEQLNDE